MDEGSFSFLASATRCIKGLAGFLALRSGRTTAASRSTLRASRATLMTWGTPRCKGMVWLWYPKVETTNLVTRSAPASRLYSPSTSVMVPRLEPAKLTLTNGRGRPDSPSKTRPETAVWPHMGKVSNRTRQEARSWGISARVVCLGVGQSKCPTRTTEAQGATPRFGLSRRAG